MIGLINFLKKRPSDKVIRIFRIIFGILIITVGYYNLIYQGDAIESTLFGQKLSENGMLYIKYFIVSLGIFPIFFGVTDMGLLKSKYIRIIQIFFGILLFYLSSIIIEGPKLDFDTLLGLLGIFPLLAGITGKCITKKGLKYGQKLTKIRV